jgi:hypothetical protein
VGTSLAAEPLLALAVTVTSEQHVESVLQSIVQGLASQPGVALARIWLLPAADPARQGQSGTAAKVGVKAGRPVKLHS